MTDAGVGIELAVDPFPPRLTVTPVAVAVLSNRAVDGVLSRACAIFARPELILAELTCEAWRAETGVGLVPVHAGGVVVTGVTQAVVHALRTP